jgi:hypothetical protein
MFMAFSFGKTGRQGNRVWSALNPIERGVLVVGAAACACICVWTASLLGIPREPGFGGSLLGVQGAGSAVTGILVVLIAIGLCSIVSGLVALMIEVESGVFCCCAGLIALAIRCGGIRPVLQYAPGATVFLAMAIELLLLAGSIFGIWIFLSRVFIQGKDLAAPNESADAPITQKLLTLGIQVLVMGVCEMILIQNDAQAQALAGVFVAGFLGVLAAYMFTPLPEGFWYWTGPAVLGIVGYLLAMTDAGSNSLGDLHGWSAALARATPLDYASAGIGGAMLGYWCSRRWAQPEETESPSV